MKSTDIHTWKTTVASFVSREDKNSNFRISHTISVFDFPKSQQASTNIDWTSVS